MSGSRDGALARAEEHFDSDAFFEDLKARIAVPTESQEPERRPDLRRYLADVIVPWLEPYGYTSEIFDNPDPRGGPFLIAERHESDDLVTLLTYGHGDVVRAIPEQWREGLEPFTLTKEGDRWYGRGSADNKGQHSVVMAALAQVLQERGSHGFNSKLLIETSEEIGSPGLEEFVAAQKDRLAADVFIASDGPRLKPWEADLKLGNRGAVAFDLSIDLREGSRHSGHWGGVLEDPGVILAHAIGAIVTKRGKILVPEWLPKSVPPRVTETLRRYDVDPADPSLVIKQDWGESSLSTPEKMFGWTSFIVLSFLCGRPENPVNGVQPNARARCQIRFTADVDPEVFVPALRKHLDREGFEMVKIEPSGQPTFPAWRTDPENPWVDWIVASMEKTLGHEARVVPNSSGGLPSAIFGNHLGCPILWIPHSYSGCRQHGPDEHAMAPIVREGLKIMTGVFWDLGETKGTPA